MSNPLQSIANELRNENDRLTRLRNNGFPKHSKIPNLPGYIARYQKRFNESMEDCAKIGMDKYRYFVERRYANLAEKGKKKEPDGADGTPIELGVYPNPNTIVGKCALTYQQSFSSQNGYSVADQQ